MRPNYLRLSMTSRCNLGCVYCAPPERAQLHAAGFEQELTLPQYARLIALFGQWGIQKVRITGGEPLMRKDLCELIEQIAAIDAIEEVALTTNGTMLFDRLPRLKAAGLDSINISVDSLRSERYRMITGKNALAEVMKAIARATEMSFQRLGINVVVLKGINDDEVVDFVRMAEEYPIAVRFIEFMNGTSEQAGRTFHLPIEAVETAIRDRYGELSHVASGKLAGPAKYYRASGMKGKIGLISFQAHGSCDSCHRLRMTSKGALLPCLFSPEAIDLRDLVRSEADDDDLQERFQRACALKGSVTGNLPRHHQTSFYEVGG